MNYFDATTCRICLEDGAIYPIFESNEEFESVYANLAVCIREKLQDLEGYPSNICLICKNTSETICNFLTRFENTNEILKSQIVQVKTEIQDVSDDDDNIPEPFVYEFQIDSAKTPQPEKKSQTKILESHGNVSIIKVEKVEASFDNEETASNENKDNFKRKKGRPKKGDSKRIKKADDKAKAPKRAAAKQSTTASSKLGTDKNEDDNRVDNKAAERSRLYRERHREEINQRRRETRQRKKKTRQIEIEQNTLPTSNNQPRPSTYTQRQQRYYERHKEEINKRKRDSRQKQNISPSIPATNAERNRNYRERNKYEINERRRHSRRRQYNVQRINTEYNIDNNIEAIEITITKATPNDQQSLISSNDNNMQEIAHNFTSTPQQHNIEHFEETQDDKIQTTAEAFQRAEDQNLILVGQSSDKEL